MGQITKAMEVVAATKMRKSQESALRTRPYAYKVFELIDRMLRYAPMESGLTKINAGAPVLYVIITSDRGLIGSFNTQVLREADRIISTDDYVIAVGRKATVYANKKKLNIVQSFEGFGEFALPEETTPLTDLIMKGYLDKKWQKVVVISTHFHTTLKQEVITRELLPLNLESVREAVRQIIPEHGKWAELSGETAKLESAISPLEDHDTYIFEPDPRGVLDSLLPHLVRMEIYDFILEANASEHSARRVAMKTASDNASELTDSLTLEYNKARQAGITREIIEITSTQNSL